MSARLKKSTMPDYTVNLSLDIWHVYNLIRTQLYNLLYTDADNCVLHYSLQKYVNNIIHSKPDYS